MSIIEPIKVAYLDYSHVFAGAEQVLHTIISSIDRRKVTPYLVFPYPQDHHERYMQLDCEKKWLFDEKEWWMGSERWKHPVRGSDFFARFIWGVKLAAYLKSNDIKILHINLLRPDCMMWVLPSHMAGVKIIGHFRSQELDWIPSRRVQKLFNLILCVSKFSQSRFLCKGRFIPTRYLYDSINMGKFNIDLDKIQALNDLGYSENTILISSVGQLSSHKGHDNAIRAFIKIASKYPQARLLIAGNGVCLEQLKKLAKQTEYAERIDILGRQVSNISQIYKASSLILSLTKVGEGFGLVPYEAALHGCPFIAPNFGAVKEFVESGKNGILVDTHDIEEIVEAIDWSLSNQSEAIDLINMLKKKIYQELTPKRMCEELVEVYQSIINQYSLNED